VERLVNVADEMDDESECLSLIILIGARPEYVYVVVQRFDDVVWLRQVVGNGVVSVENGLSMK
jgi:hypothetical protein